MTQTATRVTYPLSTEDIAELEELEKRLQGFAETAEQNQKVALHQVYHEILKQSSMAIARAKLRSTREANAERTRRHKTLKKAVAGATIGNANSGNTAP